MGVEWRSGMKLSRAFVAAVVVLTLGVLVPVAAQGQHGTGTAADFRSAVQSDDNPAVFVQVTHTGIAGDTRAVMGVSEPLAGSGIGVQGNGGKIGVLGSANLSGGGHRYGVFGSAPLGPHSAVYAAGNLAYTGDLVGPSSDLGLAESLASLDTVLSSLVSLEVTTFEYRRDLELSHMNLPEGPQVGFVAQQVAAVFPGLVTEMVHPAKSALGEANGALAAEADEPIRYLALKPLRMIPYLVKAIQEQQAQIEALQAQLGPLQRRLAAVECADAEQMTLASAP